MKTTLLLVLGLFIFLFSCQEKKEYGTDTNIDFESNLIVVDQCYPVEYYAKVYSIDKKFEIYDYSWYFEGGNPGVSDNETAVTVYNNPGTYPVILEVACKKKKFWDNEVYGSNITYSHKKEDYIVVRQCCSYTFFGELINDLPIDVYLSDTASTIENIMLQKYHIGQITVSNRIEDDEEVFCYSEGVATARFDSGKSFWYYATDGVDDYGPIYVKEYFPGNGGFSSFRVHLDAYSN